MSAVTVSTGAPAAAAAAEINLNEPAQRAAGGGVAGKSSVVEGRSAGGNAVVVEDAPYEDKIIIKVLACLPIIGEVMSFVTGYTLNKKMAAAYEEKDAPKLAKLLKISSDHAISSIVRRLLTLAALITLVAVGILSLGIAPAIIFGVVLFGAAAVSAYHIYQTKKHIEGLNNDGLNSEYWLSLAKPVVK